MTLDNAAVNNFAIEILRPSVSGFHDKLLYKRCLCHIINIIVNSGLEIIEETIQKIRQGILYLNASLKNLASWKSYCKHNCIVCVTELLDKMSQPEGNRFT